MQDYYYNLRYENHFKKLNDLEWLSKNTEEAYFMEREIKEGWLQMKNEMLQKQFRHILRVTLQFKDESLGSFEWSADQERAKRGLNADSYPNSGHHIAIFECELK